MTCYSPLTMYWTGRLTAAGRREYTFNPSKAYSDISPIKVPCGQCIGCRLAKSCDTAMRCVHEASMFEYNCFITLTVDDDHISEVFPGYSLRVEPFQLFAKRLRKRFNGIDTIFNPLSDSDFGGIRILYCGEYGSLLKRPHYHACIFNFDFPDKILWSVRDNVRLYRSPSLEELWPFGYSTIGEVNFESAAYLARYVTKKITGDLSDDHYFNPETGEYMKPEFIQFPRGFGLGRLWFEKFKSDCYPSGFLIAPSGHKIKTPEYYDKIFDIDNHEIIANIKDVRKHRALADAVNQTPERLAVREEIQLARFRKLIRGYENDK